MFTLHFIDADTGAIQPALATKDSLDFASSARYHGINTALYEGREVLIQRDGKPTIIVDGKGNARAPESMAPADPRERCVRYLGKSCFCSPCRAARKADRGI